MSTSSTSSYNAGGYGEALTSQPRSAKACTNGGMDLSYVTERIIALWFPETCGQRAFRQGQQQASHMLVKKYGDNYMVFNLSEPKRTLRSEHKHVQDVGWSPRLAPPLETICSVCKKIESWLSHDQHRIAVIHARGSKDRLGVIVAAYMHYSNICGNAEQALDRFSMRRFLEDNIGPLQLPSNKRYVDYFAGLLSHNIRINSAPLYLTHVTVLGAPNYQNGGCEAFLKLYEGHTAIYTSGVYSVSRGIKQFTVNVAGKGPLGLELRGDILLKCYHRGKNHRETIFTCQFHTGAVADYTLSFSRQDLDGACNDPRFPNDGAVELHFSPGPQSRHPGPAPTPAIPIDITDGPITRSDSPFEIEDSDDEEDSDSDEVNHTFGPLDGSIYATIAKKQELSPGAVSSPLTVSMDSGISSAGHQQNANTNASASPPLTGQPSPLSPEDQHRELDELLSDMMLTVQSIPDLKPTSASLSSESTVRFIDADEDEIDSKSIPYHARVDSRPFTYGVEATMIGEAKKLSSPSLVRKASFNRSREGVLNKVQTQVFPSEYKYYEDRERDAIDDIFTQSALNSSGYERETLKKMEMKRSYTDSTLRSEKISSHRSAPFSDPETPPGNYRQKSNDHHDAGNLTWLQKQQLKLKERRETQLRVERQPYECVMSDLRTTQSRHMRPTASHRLDGYTSDTTAFADDDDDYRIPLHINTKNAVSPTSTTSYNTIRSVSSINGRNERPFMAVKRAHEYQKSSSEAPNPLGQVIRSPSRGPDAVDAGLLSLVDQENKHRRHNTSNSVGIEDTLLREKLSRSKDDRNDALSDLMANLSHGSDKSNNSSSNSSSAWQYREDSYSTYRSTEVDSSSPHSASSRPQTPAFPVARTPYVNSSTPTVQFDLPGERLPPKSPTTMRRLSYPTLKTINSKKRLEPSDRKDRPISPSEFTNGSNDIFHSTIRSFDGYSPKSPSFNGSSSPTVYQGNSRRSSVNSNNEPPQEVSPAHVQFVSDSSRFWYKPAISREDAINMLRNQPAGTFVVRNSNTFPGAFGMALKVSYVPANVQNKDELVRHFLIEPTSRGVRLKGCQNEPVFSSLSALVYQHSITQLALPCRLILPESDIGPTEIHQVLYSQGAACNVMYLHTFDMESLTGPQAVKKAISQLFNMKPLPSSYTVHFKVNTQGITLTDNKRKLFFRKHYPINNISYCGIGPDDVLWTSETEENIPKTNSRIFGFVARKPANNVDNQCHLFVEMDVDQPATAIVNFVNKVLATSGVKPNIV
ncbi:PREDICTED: tensin, partial [Nicrophorus vespilloides]|uniref:Tensin n=1 Tax=Nicrophorus vespilloides TaxID=110193 RepID=A0ABM1N0L4_NICVS